MRLQPPARTIPTGERRREAGHTQFRHRHTGLLLPDDQNTAVCLLPGTELAFERPIEAYLPTEAHRTAIFRQVNKTAPCMHHDALELPGGQMVLLTQLVEGQLATVLQLPAKPTSPEEAREQTRAAFVG